MHDDGGILPFSPKKIEIRKRCIQKFGKKRHKKSPYKFFIRAFG